MPFDGIVVSKRNLPFVIIVHEQANVPWVLGSGTSISVTCSTLRVVMAEAS